MQWLQNKYSKIYSRIISNRQSNEPIGYFECHHIVPKSLGGQDEKSNLVNLTAREHYICHWLLTKMVPLDSPEYRKMCLAFGCMIWRKSDIHKRDYFVNGKTYERFKIEFQKSISEFQSGEKNSNYGKMWVCNPKTKQNKKIPKNEPVPNGWLKGRVMNWDKRNEPRSRTSKKHTRKCEVCEKEFECPELSGQKFCSKSCRNKNRYNNLAKVEMTRNGESKMIRSNHIPTYRKLGWKVV